MSLRRAIVASFLLGSLAACTPAGGQRPVVSTPGAKPLYSPLGNKFAEASDGTVIPDTKPDPDAVAYAARCGGGGGRAVAMGMSECDLIGLKGTPSRVVGGLDQQGGSHNAIWYIEGGRRTVYKFDNDRLVDIIQ